MPMIKLDQVPMPALLAHATTVMQLDVPEDATWAKLISLIRAANPDLTELDVEPEAGKESVSQIARSKLSTGYRNDPIVIVEVQSDETAGGRERLPICVDGDKVDVMRDVKVPLPYRFFHVLENCIGTEIYHRPKENGMGYDVSRREVKGVRYIVHERPAQKDIDDFHKRTSTIRADAKKILMENKRKRAMAA